MHRKVLVACFAAGLMFAGVACSSDDGDGGSGSVQAQVADKMIEEDPSMSEDDANCIAGAMVDVFGEDTMQEALDTDGESMDALADDDPEQALELVNKMAECDPDLLGDLGGG